MKFNETNEAIVAEFAAVNELQKDPNKLSLILVKALIKAIENNEPEAEYLDYALKLFHGNIDTCKLGYDTKVVQDTITKIFATNEAAEAEVYKVIWLGILSVIEQDILKDKTYVIMNFNSLLVIVSMAIDEACRKAEAEMKAKGDSEKESVHRTNNKEEKEMNNEIPAYSQELRDSVEDVAKKLKDTKATKDAINNDAAGFAKIEEEINKVVNDFENARTEITEEAKDDDSSFLMDALMVTAGVAVTGLAVYGVYKLFSSSNDTSDMQNLFSL